MAHTERDMNAALFLDDDWHRSAVATMAEGVVVQSEKGAIVACNPAAMRLLGVSKEGLLDSTSLDPRWRSVREDGSPFPGEEHPAMVTLRTGLRQSHVIMGVHRPDGTLVWLSVDSQPFTFDKPARRGVLITFRDVTAHRRMHAALEESEERYRAIIETSFDGVWTIDLAGNTTFANERMAELLGTTREDLSRSSMWDFVDAEDRALAGDNMRRRSEGLCEEHEFRFRRRDGSHVWTSLSTSPIWLQGKQGALAMVRDITAGHHIQDELRSSHERLGRALEAARMYAWQADADTTRLVWARNYQQVLGLPAQRTFSFAHELLELVHPGDRERVQNEVADLASGAAETTLSDFRVMSPDGKLRWIQTRAERCVDKKGHASLLGTSVDISELKELQEELLQARKLEALGQLAGGVAHDFNNLLTAILAAVDFAERGTGKQERDLATIRAAAERAATLTGQLLAFARKQALELRTIDLDALIARLDGVLHRLIGEHAALSIASTPGLWPVRADARLVEQILFNLIANASDALLGRGGHVSISTQNLSLTRAQPHLPEGAYVVLTVRDDGPGIGEEVLKHVFEPFFTTKVRGTGLGLASCYGSVKQLGGHIEVSSAPSAGATFTVYLPRATELLAEEPAAVRSERTAQRGTVLLVEDEALIRSYAARGLIERGFDVLEAESAEEAQLTFEKNPNRLDALVTDVVLPRMSGPELATRLLETRPSLPVLFVSGYTDDVLERHPPLGRTARLLPKPYSLDQLAEELRDLLAVRSA
jgi:two-component system cell cycle sensor histidine kinase/response regulator CckA